MDTTPHALNQKSAAVRRLHKADLSISDGFRAALMMLVASYDYASDAHLDAWQFAVEIGDLMTTGATRSDLRWLLLRGFATHAKEITIPGDVQRTFRLLAPTDFPSDTCLLLTHEGAAAIRGMIAREVFRPEAESVQLVLATPPLDPARMLPEWDAARRELRYAGQIVKRYRVPAENQALILAAFQEERWPTFIDDPLPPAADKNPKQRLQATLKSLNRNQLTSLIRFHGNGNGLQIFWEAVDA